MAKEVTFNSERDVKRVVKKILDDHKWFWWMTPANGFGKSGVADICALRTGVFIAIETKFKKNTPTAQQVGYLNSIRQETGFAFVINESNVGWFKVWCECFDRACEAQAQRKDVDPADGANMLDAIRMMTALIQ